MGTGKLFNYDNEEQASVNPAYLNRWYPVHGIDHLDKKKPYCIEVLSEYVVLWWDPHTEQWCAHEDQCPHRLAAMSTGRISPQGFLECSFHGRQFNGAGQCVIDPWAKVENDVSHYPGLKKIPLKIKYNLIFLFIGDHTLADSVPLIEFDYHSSSKKYYYSNAYILDTSLSHITICENLTDNGHVPFVHHGSTAEREKASSFNMEITQEDEFTFKSERSSNAGNIGKNQKIKFVAPYHVQQFLEFKFGSIENLFFLIPVNPKTTRLIQITRLGFNSKIFQFIFNLIPSFLIHAQGGDILDQDASVLMPQARNYAKEHNENILQKMHCTYLDKYPNIVLKVFEKIGPPFLNAVSPLPAIQLERDNHILHCKACRKALSFFSIMKLLMAIVTLSCVLYAFFIGFNWWAGTGFILGALFFGIARHLSNRIRYVQNKYNRDKESITNPFFIFLKWLGR